MNSLFERALRNEPVERWPIWLMRQAGRYMPSYQRYRSQHALKDLFYDSHLAAEITLLPEKELGIDALIIFSDILLILNSLGFDVDYPEEGGPSIFPRIQHPLDLSHMRQKSVTNSLSCVAQAIEMVKKKSNLPLIGFCGGPFTVASYALEPRNKHASLYWTKRFMMEYPKEFETFLELITEQTIEYLKMQVDAGACCVQVFDSWAGVLDIGDFQRYSLSFLSRIIEALAPVPVLFFCRGSYQFLDEIVQVSPGAISLDWAFPLKKARALIDSSVLLQGNFDPHRLFLPPKDLKKKIERELEGLPNQGVILNLGHGVLPHTPYEHVKAFVTTLREVGERLKLPQYSHLN